MKVFHDFPSAFKWTDEIVKKGKDYALKDIAEQVYKDSEIYTYEDTKEMYKSGATNSIFNKGTVILRTPYVKLRYYIGGKANAKHPTGVPQWFEATKQTNMKSYIKKCIECFRRAKGV